MAVLEASSHAGTAVTHDKNMKTKHFSLSPDKLENKQMIGHRSAGLKRVPMTGTALYGEDKVFLLTPIYTINQLLHFYWPTILCHNIKNPIKPNKTVCSMFHITEQ